MRITADYVREMIVVTDGDPADLEDALAVEGIDHAADGGQFYFGSVDALRQAVAVARGLGAEVERETMGKAVPLSTDAAEDLVPPERRRRLVEQPKDVNPGESEDEQTFVSRCIAFYVNEGKDQDQAAAICYDKWSSKSSFKGAVTDLFNAYRDGEDPEVGAEIMGEIDDPETEVSRLLDMRGTADMADWMAAALALAGRDPSAVLKSETDKAGPGPSEGKSMNEDLNFYVNREGAKLGFACYLSDLNGDNISTSGAVKVLDTLPPGVYDLGVTFSGEAVFTRKGSKSDELIRFDDARQDAVSAEIRAFWALKSRYDELGLVHKRGVMLYGKPGTGKTCLLKRISEEAVLDGSVVVYSDDLYSVSKGLAALREVEPERPLLVVLEDVDAMMEWGGEHALLELFDGEKTVGGVCYLATTNYPDRLDGRVTRAGRLDTKVEIGNPPVEGRLAYLKARVPGISDEDAGALAEAAEDFSFAEMRELVVSVYALGADPREAIKRIKATCEVEGTGPSNKDLGGRPEAVLASKNKRPEVDDTPKTADPFFNVPQDRVDSAMQDLSPDQAAVLGALVYGEGDLPDPAAAADLQAALESLGYSDLATAVAAYSGESGVPLDRRPTPGPAVVSPDDDTGPGGRRPRFYLQSGLDGEKTSDAELSDLVAGLAEMGDQYLADALEEAVLSGDESAIDEVLGRVADEAQSLTHRRMAEAMMGEGMDEGQKYQLPGADEAEVGDALEALGDADAEELLVRCVYEEGFQPDAGALSDLLQMLQAGGFDRLAGAIADAYGMKGEKDIGDQEWVEGHIRDFYDGGEADTRKVADWLLNYVDSDAVMATVEAIIGSSGDSEWVDYVHDVGRSAVGR